MKRIVVLLLFIISLACVLLSCSSQDADMPEQPSTDLPSADQLPEAEQTAAPDTQLTVDEVVAQFDPKTYYAQVYDEAMIDSIKAKLVLEGDIISVVHITNQNTAVPNLEWVYVYEFSDERDAEWMEENRRTFVSGMENGDCIRSGKVVVFGNSTAVASFAAE